MVAKATPCGSTIIAPVIPAIRSSLVVARLTIGHQRRKGKTLLIHREVLGVVITGLLSVFFRFERLTIHKHRQHAALANPAIYLLPVTPRISRHALIIEILRVFRFREKIPALRDRKS